MRASALSARPRLSWASPRSATQFRFRKHPATGDIETPGSRTGGAGCYSRTAADVTAGIRQIDCRCIRSGIDNHAIAIVAVYVHGPERVRNHRKELSVPDLDLIKQAEQGRGTGADGLPRAAPAILPGRRRG
jgi:hypothetical protein